MNLELDDLDVKIILHGQRLLRERLALTVTNDPGSPGLIEFAREQREHSDRIVAVLREPGHHTLAFHNPVPQPGLAP